MTFYGVHFDNIEIRKSFCILLEVDVRSLIAIHRQEVLLTRGGTGFSLFVANPAWEIDIPCCEDALVEVVVERPSTDRYLITMDSKDVTEGLTF